MAPPEHSDIDDIAHPQPVAFALGAAPIGVAVLSPVPTPHWLIRSGRPVGRQFLAKVSLLRTQHFVRLVFLHCLWPRVFSLYDGARCPEVARAPFGDSLA